MLKTAFPGFRVHALDDDRSWHHAILTTNGAWLPGDKRGFRTPHHREGRYILRHERDDAWVGVWKDDPAKPIA